MDINEKLSELSVNFEDRKKAMIEEIADITSLISKIKEIKDKFGNEMINKHFGNVFSLLGEVSKKDLELIEMKESKLRELIKLI